jgi:predicted HTH transcriptional regulator
MPPIQTIASILNRRTLSDLQGVREDQWFDAKQPPGYDLTTPAGRFELAKDVSSFANAEGGHIVIGLTTSQIPEEQTEEVNGLALVHQGALNIAAIEGVIAEYVYPSIQGLQVSWVEDIAGTGVGVGVISIPLVPLDRRFFLMKKVLDEGTPLPQIAFGVAVRRGSNSIPFNVDQLYRMCQEGRSTVAERLARIESKLDTVLQEPAQPPVHPQENNAELVRQRIQRILGDE